MKVYEVLQLLGSARKLIADHLSLQQLQVFLVVVDAGRTGIDQSTLRQRTSMTTSHCSATVLKMTAQGTHRNRGRGMGLLSSETNPSNLRERIVRLSEEGETIAAELLGKNAKRVT